MKCENKEEAEDWLIFLVTSVQEVSANETKERLNLEINRIKKEWDI